MLHCKMISHQKTLFREPLLKRDCSPHSRKQLLSFMLNFTSEKDVSISNHVDLYQHSVDCGVAITDSIVQEVCAMNPHILSLNLHKCDITDAGVSVISRYCLDLQEICLSECHDITNLGLRSLSMKCTQLQLIDFTNCSRLDDMSLRVVAASLERLRTLILSGCKKITDMGMREIAHCCTELVLLDLRNCERIGEFGNYALCAIGKHCRKLETLDMRGCHVSDAGIRAIGRGCINLSEFHISHCAKVSGKALLELASKCKKLTTLSVIGCDKIANTDMCKIVCSCNQVEILDLSESQLSAKGIASITILCPKLRELRMSKCTCVDDDGALAVTKGAADIQKLDISYCTNITEQGVKNLVPIGSAGLSYLNLSGCKQIEQGFIYNIAPSFRFSVVSDSFLGFIPRLDESTLRVKAKVFEINTSAAIKMQRCTRGWITREGKVKRRKIDWTIEHKLPQLQALVRGGIQRRAFRKERQNRLQSMAAARISAGWRGSQSRRLVKYLIASNEELAQKKVLAAAAQKIYRGYRGRIAAKELLFASARRRLEVAKEHARRSNAAVEIQRIARVAQSRVLLRRLIAKHEDEKRIRMEQWESVLLIQRIYRGMQGRAISKQVRFSRETFEAQWYLAREIQRVWRGLVGREHAKFQSKKIDEQHKNDAAIMSQRIWRGYKTRDKITIAKSIERLREREIESALALQRIYRGKQGQQKAEQVRAQLKEEQSRFQAAILIQRCFRGYKGRTRFSVLQAAMEIIRPLRAELKQRKIELGEVRKEVTSSRDFLAASQKNATLLEKEVAVVQKTKSKHWDSNQITGTPQRFVTELLKVRLQEKLIKVRSKTDCIAAEHEEFQARERELVRVIRETEKKLDSLQQGPGRFFGRGRKLQRT